VWPISGLAVDEEHTPEASASLAEPYDVELLTVVDTGYDEDVPLELSAFVSERLTRSEGNHLRPTHKRHRLGVYKPSQVEPHFSLRPGKSRKHTSGFCAVTATPSPVLVGSSLPDFGGPHDGFFAGPVGLGDSFPGVGYVCSCDFPAVSVQKRFNNFEPSLLGGWIVTSIFSPGRRPSPSDAVIPATREGSQQMTNACPHRPLIPTFWPHFLALVTLSPLPKARQRQSTAPVAGPRL